ncbi:hypothetical protein BC939DRAFT_527339 [Gamsiella multidivaricata]|uniref:uncharacterized protein n=1 Tax=Gamsiella multidivaricata TaxID=101098 RepID=UPI0022207C4E|nr:uncharacterized protein BC939DRAFT_527339 [Gamsiella multidivaricata]KAG0356123.1 hypothetical protein BGZ54_000840 [Gamsiella multidivaricata]KAI7827100.1 hypothetical protein BC939DRAFT_527339 [Gamsiella multidivaricata]
MATLSHSCNTSQVAEALLSRARRLSNNAFERTRPSPMALAEGHNHLHLTSSTFCSRPGSFSHIQTRRRSATSTSSRSSSSFLTSASLSTPTTVTTTTPTTEFVITAEYLSEEEEEEEEEKEQQSLNVSLATMVQSPMEEKEQYNSGASEHKHPSIHSDGSNKSTFFDSSRAHTLTCATIAALRQGTSLSSKGSSGTRPRALTLGNCVPDTAASTAAAVDLSVYRKYLSENMSSKSHVYGVLAAIRQTLEVESPLNLKDTVDPATSAISPMMATEMTMTAGAALDAGQALPSRSSSSTSDVSEVATESDEVKKVDRPSGLSTTKESTLPSPSTSSPHVVPETTTKLEAEMSAPTLAPSSSSAQKESSNKESRGTYFLQKMWMRRSSVNGSASMVGAKDSSDTSSIASHTSHHSTKSSLSMGSKRSSRLLGKFMPKFLQTSQQVLSQSSTQSMVSLSQSSTLSPLSGQSSRRSSVVVAQAQEGMVSTKAVATVTMPGSTSASSKGSQESLPLEIMLEKEEEACEPKSMSPTAPERLEYLRSETLSFGRRSSCSSESSKMSDMSFASKPSGCSMSSVDDLAEIKQGGGGYVFSVECEDVEVEEDDDSEDALSSKNSANNTSRNRPMSPYVIDEDSDDEFFLNSVLRKRPSMPLSLPSNAKMSSSVSMRSGAMTPPSLLRPGSTWSNPSSRSSTPSPMSPNSDQAGRPFMRHAAMTMHMRYRSSPLPELANAGVDEKRRRLRDAVCEWRRAASVSS